jgi:hypothetical protein
VSGHVASGKTGGYHGEYGAFVHRDRPVMDTAMRHTSKALLRTGPICYRFRSSNTHTGKDQEDRDERVNQSKEQKIRWSFLSGGPCGHSRGEYLLKIIAVR